MGHDTVSFDVEDANRSIAVILRELDKFKVAMKKLEDAVKESETWRVGSSRAPFVRKANENIQAFQDLPGRVHRI